MAGAAFPYRVGFHVYCGRGLLGTNCMTTLISSLSKSMSSGWGLLGDVSDVHTYPAPRLRPNASARQYAMIGEFGGIGAFVPGKEWRPPTPTHKSCFAYNLPLHPLATPSAEAQAYIKMTHTLLSWSDTLSASVYTQITDVELECDGFLNYDRSNKFDEASIAAIKSANMRLIHKASGSGGSGNGKAGHYELS